MPHILARKLLVRGTSLGRPGLVLGLSLCGCIAAALFLTMPPTGAPAGKAYAQVGADRQSNPATSIAASDATAVDTACFRQPWQLPFPEQNIQLCQALGPAAPYAIRSVDCADGNCGTGWRNTNDVGWQYYAQGEYVGHQRIQHVPEYRLRVDDKIDLIFRVTRDETSKPYQLNVGDEVRVESFTDQGLNRDLIIQPDGTITLRLLGQIRATRHTVTQLRDEIDELYRQYYKVPAITVTPLKVNAKLEDLRATVDSRFGFGGQARQARVTPEGTIALPAIGNVMAQGLTLGELKRELDERYAQEVEGLEITPVLFERAPRFIYVLGQVRAPGRYDLTGPTTAMQAISMAGSWEIGSNLRQVVVFRRGDDWRLMATMLDLRGAIYGKTSCPSDEIWLNDSDIVVVPPSPIQVADNFIELVFTRGLYGIIPFNASTNVNWSIVKTLQ